MEEEVEDRISLLPDCLILEILSRLPATKEAIKTGTLSKRWQHLWTIVPNLIFLHYSNDNRLLRDFYLSVDKTMSQCRHLNLNIFELLTQYDIQFEPQINNWIQFAIRCNVQKLELTFWGDDFVLNDYFFTTICFTDLRLSRCVFNLNPGGVITWNKLTNLCIRYGKLNEDLIQTILSGSPLLETLELSHCYGYKRLDITSKSVKNLSFAGYYNYDDQSDIIEINAPYVLSLRIEFDLYLWKLLLLNVSSLVKAFLDYYKRGYYDTTAKEAEEEMLKGFILKLRHVKKLTIGSCCAETLSRLEAKGLTFPSNLKVLDVSSDEDLDLEDEDSEVDELFDSDSDENGDWEDEGSEADEPFDSNSSHENEDCTKEEVEDRISLLPDCLILEILSRLPCTKEAIKTGTLSKRWQHLWTLVPNLIFVHHAMDNRPLHNFYLSIDKTLSQCRHLNLNKFVLFTQYDIQFESQFNKWIQFAIRCNVQKLKLVSWGDEFVLNDYFFTTTCFTHLTLLRCVFNLNPSCVITWSKLTSLCISDVKLNEDLIQTILSGSPLLETLELSHCYGYKRLDITSKSVKNLLFSGYQNCDNGYDDQSDIPEINAPYILSLRIESALNLWKLLLLNVSSLVEAFLDYSKGGYYETTAKVAQEEVLKGLILKLSHVKKLIIGISCARTLSRLEAKGLILPSNLKVLDVTSPEYGDVICDPSDSDSDVSGDWEEPLHDESSEVDELFESDSDENGDWEEEGSEIDEFDSDSDENGDREEGSEVDELFESDSDENGDWEEEGSEVDEFDENGDREEPLLDEAAEVDDLSHNDSVESRDYEGSEVD